MSYHNNNNTSSSPTKEKNGMTAPLGFHYMDDGTLMSDAAHARLYGSVENIITSLDISTRDLNHLGETRHFSVLGNGIFSLEISHSDSGYYNFNTQTWSTTKSGLYNIELTKKYNSTIIFPPASKLLTYTVHLLAETIEGIKTRHSDYFEVLNADGSINVNKCTGSNSNLLKRIIYGDTAQNLYLSCIAPSLTNVSTDLINGTVTSTDIVIDGDATSRSVVQIGDKVTTVDTPSDSGAVIVVGDHAIVTGINPDNNNTHEIEIGFSDAVSDNHTITFTPPFNGMTPNGTINTTGRQALEVSSGGSLQKSFSITCTALAGRTFSSFKVPTTNDLCVYEPITFEAAALAIPGEDTDSDAKFFRWPVTNIAYMKEGMILDPARTDGDGAKGANTTTPAKISKYLSTKTNAKIYKRKYFADANLVTVSDVSVNGVDSYSSLITAIDRNGRVTAQKGNIVFDVQQLDALKTQTAVRMFAYGEEQIRSLTGMNVKLSNVVVTPTQVLTTTSSASSGSATIGLDQVQNISAGMTIRGVGINASVADPTVSRKFGISGAANITASAVQTIEDNQTLYFDGASNIITITGTITVSNMEISDRTLFLDVERFLTAR